MCDSQTCTNMYISTFSTKHHLFITGLELLNEWMQNNVTDSIRVLATSSLYMEWIENIKNVYFRYTTINYFFTNNFLFRKLMSWRRTLSKMNCYKSLTISAESSFINVWLCPKYGSIHRRCYSKQVFLKISQYSQENFVKTILQHRLFPVNFLRTPVLKNIGERVLL